MNGLRPFARPEPLAIQAYNAIRRDLLYGELRGSKRLTEHALARRYKISRTPIREALQRLAIVGFLEAAPGGYAPKRASARDLAEIRDLRLLLEPLAASLAAERITPPQLHELRNLAALTSTATVLQPEELAEVKMRFHGALAEASGNATLARVVIAVINRSAARAALGAAPAHPRHVDCAVAHSAIVTAVAAGNPRAAAAALEADLRGGRTAAPPWPTAPISQDDGPSTSTAFSST